MRFEQIKFRNFSSYGNEWQIVEFSKNGALHQIQGKNGSGKTSILDAMLYMVYGKCDRRLQDLPNRINQKLEVHGTLYANGKDIKIERGIKPNYFNLYIDNEIYDRANKTDTQAFLENEILKIPYDVARNLMLLSVNDFQSFLSMSVASKRSIVDSLFDFTIFNDMKENAKKDLKDLQGQLSTKKALLADNNSMLANLEYKSKLAMESDARRNESEKMDCEKRKESLQELINTNSFQRNTLMKEMSDINAKMESIKANINDLRSQGKVNVEKLKLYADDSCPTCGSNLATPLHECVKTDLENANRNLKEQFNKANGELSILQESYNAKNVELSGIVSSLNTWNFEMRALIARISELSKIVIVDSNLHELMDSCKDKIKMYSEAILQLEVDIRHIEYTINTFFNDKNGLKNFAISSIVPILNANIKKYSDLSRYAFSLSFDSKFDCTIKNAMGEDVYFSTLSVGERKKGDTIIILSMIEILLAQHPTLNVIFLDEIFSSLDPDHIQNVIDVLSAFSKANSMDIFIISHSNLPLQSLDYLISVEKDNHFSTMDIKAIR